MNKVARSRRLLNVYVELLPSGLSGDEQGIDGCCASAALPVYIPAVIETPTGQARLRHRPHSPLFATANRGRMRGQIEIYSEKP
jgi:hypothetical protein